jgi:hypothetical protein
MLSVLIGVGIEDGADRTVGAGVGTGGALKLKVNGSCCRLVVLCSEFATLAEVAAPSSIERTRLVLKPRCERVGGRGVLHADDDALSD